MYLKNKGMYLNTNSLSLTERRSIIHGEKLEGVVGYADLRGFAQWSLTSTAADITRIIEVVYDRVIQLAFFYKHTFHKFLGDGFVLIWEVKDHGSRAEALHWAMAAAFEIHKRYWYIAQQLRFPAPSGFGIGISDRKSVVEGKSVDLGGVLEFRRVLFRSRCTGRWPPRLKSTSGTGISRSSSGSPLPRVLASGFPAGKWSGSIPKRSFPN